MAQVRDIFLRFRQGTGGVVANRVRIRPANTPAAYDEPFHEVRPAPTPDAQGYVVIPLESIPQAAGLEGQYDVHVTALDAVGHESDFLELDNQTFDLSPPTAPTDGSIVYGD